MEEAKYILQDMFHTFWWAYDWYKYAIEPTGPVNWKPSENVIAQFMAQGLPDMPCQWMQMAGCHQEDPDDVCDASDAPDWWPSSACTKPSRERLGSTRDSRGGLPGSSIRPTPTFPTGMSIPSRPRQ